MNLWDSLTLASGIGALVGAMATEHFMGGGLIRGLLGLLCGTLIAASSMRIMRTLIVSLKRPSETTLRLIYLGAVGWFFLTPFVSLAATQGVIRLVLGPEEHFIKQEGSSR
jgi:hypothetical protein